MDARQPPASVSVNSAILPIIMLKSYSNSQVAKMIFSYLSLLAFCFVTGEALPPPDGMSLVVRFIFEACRVWWPHSPNHFCVCRLKCFFDLQSLRSHGEFISVHVLPVLPGVQHPGRGARASVDLHIRGGTAWHIWGPGRNGSSAANSGKYSTRSIFSSLLEWVQGMKVYGKTDNVSMVLVVFIVFGFFLDNIAYMVEMPTVNLMQSNLCNADQMFHVYIRSLFFVPKSGETALLNDIFFKKSVSLQCAVFTASCRNSLSLLLNNCVTVCYWVTYLRRCVFILKKRLDKLNYNEMYMS